MVSADYSNTDTGELGVVMGQFNSPFRALYSGSVGGDDGAAFGHFVLWEWYRNRYFAAKTVPSEKLASLSWFKGLAMYRVSKQQRSLDGRIDVKGSASYLGFVNASGNLSAQYKNYGFLDVSSYKLAIFVSADSGHPTYEFAWLDTRSIVANWLGQKAVAKYVTKEAQPSLHKGVDVRQQQQITGVPNGLCSRGSWKADPEIIADVGTLSVTGAVAQDNSKQDGSLPTCTIEVTYTPADSLFAGPGLKSASPTYKLKTMVADVGAAIPAQTISYQTSDLPALSATTATPYPFDTKPQAGGTLLNWKVTVNVDQDTSEGAAQIDVKANPRMLGAITMTGCRTVQGARPPVISKPPFNGNQQLEFTVSEFIVSASTFKTDAPDAVTCGISGTLQGQFTKGGGFVSLSLPDSVLLTYPNPGSEGFKPGTVQKVSQ